MVDEMKEKGYKYDEEKKTFELIEEKSFDLQEAKDRKETVPR